ncbi:hypothetical protein A2U01_0071308, partial [Trifolium medium]|nr:hypothetical protein [Trifolium medium]
MLENRTGLVAERPVARSGEPSQRLTSDFQGMLAKRRIARCAS